MEKQELHAIKYSGIWALCRSKAGEWVNVHTREPFCYIGAEEKTVTLD
jgi:hypothetical protein